MLVLSNKVCHVEEGKMNGLGFRAPPYAGMTA